MWLRLWKDWSVSKLVHVQICAGVTSKHLYLWPLKKWSQVQAHTIQRLDWAFYSTLSQTAGSLRRPKSHTVLLLALCRRLLRPLCKFSSSLTANGMHSAHTHLIGEGFVKDKQNLPEKVIKKGGGGRGGPEYLGRNRNWNARSTQPTYWWRIWKRTKKHPGKGDKKRGGGRVVTEYLWRNRKLCLLSQSDAEVSRWIHTADKVSPEVGPPTWPLSEPIII